MRISDWSSDVCSSDLLLLDGAADRQQADRCRRIAAVAPGRCRGGGGKAAEIEAVVEQVNAVGSLGQDAQVPGAEGSAGDQPAHLGQLLALLPVRHCPDVLRVRRGAPDTRTVV